MRTHEMQLKQIDDAITILKLQHHAVIRSILQNLNRRNLVQTELPKDQKQSNPVLQTHSQFLSTCAASSSDTPLALLQGNQRSIIAQVSQSNEMVFRGSQWEFSRTFVCCISHCEATETQSEPAVRTERQRRSNHNSMLQVTRAKKRAQPFEVSSESRSAKRSPY